MSTSERAPAENTYALRDRVALITGANGALGAVIAQAFVASGARVTGVTRSEASQTGSDAGITYEVADVSDEAAVEALIARVVREFGTLDIVVNTVGGFAAGQPVTDLALDTWESMLSLNARTAFL